VVRDARNEALTHARDCLDLPPAGKAAEKAARDLRLAVGVDAGRFSAAQLHEKPEFDAALTTLIESLERFCRHSGNPGRTCRRPGKVLAACGRIAGSPAPLAAAGRSRLCLLGRGVHPVVATECNSARRGGDFSASRWEGIRAPGVFYLGDAGGTGALPSLLQRNGPGRTGVRLLAKPLRLRQAGRAVRAVGNARAE